MDWYRTPDKTHNRDGRHIHNILKNETFPACDRELWLGLEKIVLSGVRQIAALEQSGLLEALQI